MKPIVIMPKLLESFAPKGYKSYGGNIKFMESNFTDSIESKNIVCFIGGFLDSYYMLMYDVFRGALEGNFMIKDNTKSKTFSIKNSNFHSMYLTFNCFKFLREFIPNALNSGFRFYILAHSWGAKNIVRLNLAYNFEIEYLLTLDCVGYIKITHRPGNIKLWENIYIADFYSHYNRANLAAIIGHGQQFIKFADINTALHPPHHHASLQEMLRESKYVEILDSNNSQS